MLEIDTFEIDLLQAIKDCGQHATESNILRRLYKKYGYHATMFFNDSIRNLEFHGKIVAMRQGLTKWWEID